MLQYTQFEFRIDLVFVHYFYNVFLFQRVSNIYLLYFKFIEQ